ncbi:MAG: pentapeptide repeat-containing protein [Polyangiaceae bacterium]|nr:pentapeptide repeat-containing protein [Polyangiaceae bacterium]
MKKNILMLVAALVSSAFTGACTAPTADSGEDIAKSEQEMRLMNGDRLSGVALSGSIVNGASLSGVRLTGMQLAGSALKDVELNGTVLSGALETGEILVGIELIGAKMTGVLTDGTEVTLRIDDVVTTADPDILNYKVSYLDPNGSSSPVCGLDSAGLEIMSFPLAGRYDHSAGTPTGGSFIDDATQFSLACKGAAIAKCAELGYKPFQSVTECNSAGQCHDVSLAPLHQACVRMVRADYCGDGVSHTYNGTEVDVFDAFGIKDEDLTVPGGVEAEWGVDGAQCILHTRWAVASYGDVEQYMAAHCPGRFDPQSPVCARSTSTYNTDVGYSVALEDRALLRNRSVQH